MKGKWKTFEGQVLNIPDMETRHIENCIRYLQRRIIDEWEVNGLDEQLGYGGLQSMEIQEYNKIIENKIEEFEKELKNRESLAL